ncbi:mechanosensitive ion channel family protein [Kiloniella sp. b19]|uniref:mechanosensitive ion channel family protein n=1 Tax=Kiloniella sp. GXU_MW_B19 TaxID=3141326 RepID=UPI0031E120B8
MADHTPEFVKELLGEQFVETSFGFAVDIVTALVILIIGFMIAGFIAGRVRSLLMRSGKIDDTLRPLLVSIVRYTILAFVLVAVLGQFGVETASIIAVLGAAGLAIGLALQGTLQNVAAGVMLLILRPMKVGEYVDADGVAGTIKEIGLFVSEMETIDGLYLSVPNSRLWSAVVTNYSRNTTRRTDLVVGIGYGDDIGKAHDAIMAVIKADERIFTDPEPVVLNAALGESSVDLNIRYWTKSSDYFPCLSDNTRAVKEALDKAGINIPYPQRDLHIVSDVRAAR